MNDAERELLRELLQRLQAGDKVAFEQFYSLMVRKCISYFMSERRTYRLTREETEDLVQETMLALFEKLPDFDPEGEANLPTWCYTVAIRKASHLRRERRYLTQFDDTDEDRLLSSSSPEEELEHQSATSSEEENLEIWLKGEGRVRHVLRSLDEIERFIVLSKSIYGLTHKQIAAKLGKSEGAVRVDYHRVKNKLKPLLKGILRKTHGQ